MLDQALQLSDGRQASVRVPLTCMLPEHEHGRVKASKLSSSKHTLQTAGAICRETHVKQSGKTAVLHEVQSAATITSCTAPPCGCTGLFSVLGPGETTCCSPSPNIPEMLFTTAGACCGSQFQ